MHINTKTHDDYDWEHAYLYVLPLIINTSVYYL